MDDIKKSINDKLIKFEPATRIKGLINILYRLTENERKSLSLDDFYNILVGLSEEDNQKLKDMLDKKGVHTNYGEKRK